MSEQDGLIDYGPHKLCTKHKSNIPVTAKCVYCELKDTAALDRADVLKMNKLEAEVRELRAEVCIGDKYTCKCELMCNHKQHNTVIALTVDTVTYEYYSTNINGDRYRCEDTTTLAHFMKMNKKLQPTKGDGGE